MWWPPCSSPPPPHVVFSNHICPTWTILIKNSDKRDTTWLLDFLLSKLAFQLWRGKKQIFSSFSLEKKSVDAFLFISIKNFLSPNIIWLPSLENYQLEDQRCSLSFSFLQQHLSMPAANPSNPKTCRFHKTFRFQGFGHTFLRFPFGRWKKKSRIALGFLYIHFLYELITQ